MTLMLDSGVGIEVQPIDAVARDSATLEADALIVPARALRAPERLSRLAQRLMGSRCVVVAVLGPEAERIHDELDALLVGDGTAGEPLPTTTWHEEEGPGEILELIEQMVSASGGPHGRPLILVTPLSPVAPANLPELLRLLAAEIQRPQTSRSLPTEDAT